ncbi:hypothetical protein HNV10_02665 [Winogradskyella litoriviva]|uniref:Lipoprotein n=1 Tax=Winogradskyella litoriviva TaxID=1220182 RepID=A0ABX2E0X8_9FLAO|nr:hypothetical protein [Winogradskyella litoriviva]NRD22126.1 hypothetical protein [Winogradskyella litoriviva]
MKPLRNTIATLLVVLLFNHCSSVPKLQKDAPKALKEVYYQKWNSGLKNGDSGIDLYVKLRDNNIVLDLVYFRGQVSRFKNSQHDSTLFIAQFNSQIKKPISLKDSSLSSFQINDNECVIRYSRQKNKTQLYYKISNIKIQETINYPIYPTKI